jgi:predicted ester cyclase
MSISGKAMGVLVAALCVGCGSDDGGGEPTGSDPQAFMGHYFEVFDAKVTDDILGLYSPEVTAEISGLGVLEGRDALRDAWLVPFTTAFPDYTHTVQSLELDADRVHAEFVFTGTHQAPLLGSAPTGKELVLPITGSYEISDQTVVAFELEYDLGTVLAAIQP